MDLPGLITSNDTHSLTFLNADDLSVIKVVPVLNIFGEPISQLNELELIDDHLDTNLTQALSNYIFANELGTDYIHMISLDSGYVVRIW